MADLQYSDVSIERIENLSIVSLKVSSKSLESARNKMKLASPSSISGSDPRSLWLGPDRWLLIGYSASADSLIEKCEDALSEVLHNAVDNSSGLAVFRIVGPGARDLLAAGCGIDFRAKQFPVGDCCRTRFAQIAAVIAADDAEHFDIYVDRSYEGYLDEWLRDSLSISAGADSG